MCAGYDAPDDSRRTQFEFNRRQNAPSLGSSLPILRGDVLHPELAKHPFEELPLRVGQVPLRLLVEHPQDVDVLLRLDEIDLLLVGLRMRDLSQMNEGR